MRRLFGGSVCFALALLSSGPLVAQSSQVRHGFWLGVGAGWGSFAISCSTCVDTGRETTLMLNLRMGGTVSPKLLVGGELVGWGKSESGHSVTAGNITFGAYFYPMEESGLFVSGGFGVSAYSQSTTIYATGTGFTVGTGYDIRVARKVSITPVAHYVWGSPGDVQNSGYTMLTGLKQNLVDLGLNLTFH